MLTKITITFQKEQWHNIETQELVDLNGEDSCPLCLTQWAEHDVLFFTPCKHVAHKHCLILAMFEKPSICPICNQTFIQDNSFRMPVAMRDPHEFVLEDMHDLMMEDNSIWTTVFYCSKILNFIVFGMIQGILLIQSFLSVGVTTLSKRDFDYMSITTIPLCYSFLLFSGKRVSLFFLQWIFLSFIFLFFIDVVRYETNILTDSFTHEKLIKEHIEFFVLAIMNIMLPFIAAFSCLAMIIASWKRPAFYFYFFSNKRLNKEIRKNDIVFYR